MRAKVIILKYQKTEGNTHEVLHIHSVWYIVAQKGCRGKDRESENNHGRNEKRKTRRTKGGIREE